jgi:aminomethyltransferase
MAMNKTRLYEKHIELNAKMVDFSGWSMPINYGSQINEHNAVRSHVGIFDVSHMTVFDLSGSEQVNFLRKLLPNNVDKIKDSQKALYSPLLNESGGILDDLIVYNLGENFRIISNCATSSQNNSWFVEKSKSYDVDIYKNKEVSIIAVQGPKSQDVLENVGFNNLKNLSNFELKFEKNMMIAKTGYTGEEGFEIVLENKNVEHLWQELINAKTDPIGLGARDTLRLEAGLNLYGIDMNLTNHPYESNLSWTLDLKDDARDFIGKEAILKINQDNAKELKGVILRERGILRSHQKLDHEGGKGEILSGTFSPSLGFSVGIARLDKGHNGLAKVFIRNKEFNVEIVSLPFIRKGKILI